MSALTAEIHVYLKDIGTGNLYELPYKSINYIEELNAGKSMTFQLDYNAIKELATTYGTTPKDLFTATLREIWVEITMPDASPVIPFISVVSEYNRTKDVTGTYQLQIPSIDYFALLQKRRTGLTQVDFTSQDPVDIAWSLINTSQGLTYGDLGITRGVHPATGLSVTVSYINAELKTEITNLSNNKQNGSFDLDIDSTKTFNTYYPTKGSVRSNIVLDDNNILADGVKIPVVLAITNDVNVTGQSQTGVNRVASNPTINAYKRLQDTISDTTVTDTTILNAEGDKFLTLNQLPLYQISVTHDGQDPDITTYDVGDTLIVNIPEEDISYAQYRVKKRTVDINSSGQILVQLDMLLI